MIDTFYIGAYWKYRQERLQPVVEKTVGVLNGLKKVDKQFMTWYELGGSRKKALEKMFNTDHDSVNEAYQKMIRKNDIDQQGYSKVGFQFSLWSGHSDDETSNISIIAGTHSDHIANNCIVSIPDDGEARSRLLRLDKVKSVINILIDNWDPEIVILKSSTLSRTLQSTNRLGWVSYFAQPQRLAENSGLVHEKAYHGQGDLFYLDGELLVDYSRMEDFRPLKELSNW
ncbi:hypothetical protein BDD43_2987 [Mucilaginibacter gracilis]|uniref:Immunity protein 52 domain-containing protein n=1 Tax=Mucilaginibacter gracilis TaxID=423350 RepID=A0A495J352_9SPHI|nr:Imm52 family immunity protein [Mucilaginibacter gracilis]RKR82798.1 hypothetical protein BDD43_2987 [Mucilaginibacter gracilis]